MTKGPRWNCTSTVCGGVTAH